MKKNIYLPVTLILFFTIVLINQPLAKAEGDSAMHLKSSAFNNGEMIPGKYTCDGTNVSPSLEWASVPADTQSFALVCDDPDAPMGTWVHWVYYDIPAGVKHLPENVAPSEHPPSGGTHGVNDFRKTGYGGPCPPGGTHRYYFKIYALDVMLNLPSGATKKEILTAMRGHILGQAKLMGKYKRQ